ncbi:MAG: DNA replication/repair protein RecF [Candidatus Hydrogenedentota bacterium]
MHLTSLTAEGFRCLEPLTFEPAPGVNILRGDNAQGKTSVLEAVLFLVTARSHRTNTERELVQRDAEGFRIRGAFQRSDRPLQMEVNWWRNAKRFKVNGVIQDRVSDILGKVNVVFFAPEDVALIRGAGSLRRRFLDMELSQLSSRYLHALQRYRESLRQRNELLRSEKADEALLDVWDAQLVQHGAVLIEERTRFVEDLNEHARQAHACIADGEVMGLAYAPDVSLETGVEVALRKARHRDIKRGATNRGPHRDDLELVVGDRPARNYASQGQQRTAALALKLAEVALIQARTGEYPLLMLDDVLSELDAKRSRRLLEAVPAGVQCILTTTENDGGNPAFEAADAQFIIDGGCLARR